MKHLIYITIIFLSIKMNGQSLTEIKQFRIDLLTIEKNTNDILIGSIIEVFSGDNRIETDISNFDGISIFHLKSKDIKNNKVLFKIHGMKCSLFEKEYELTDDLNTTIYLEYGASEYTNRNQLSEMYNKLKIKPKVFECKVVEPIIIYKN